MSCSSPQACANVAADGSQQNLSELIDHIVQSHHAYLRRELPVLNKLAQTCEATLPEHTATVKELRNTLLALTQELMQHMQKEEMVLFPWIEQLEASGTSGQRHCGTIAAPVQVMEHEHRFACEALFLMRCATNDYNIDNAASSEYQTLVKGLAALETDLHQHIHEENDILFPRALQLEAMLFSNA